MATKNISLSEDAYELLASLKEEDVSFSDVVRRLARAHRDLSGFSGAFPEIGDVADRSPARRFGRLTQAYPEHSEFDLMIAAIVVAADASLLTRDADFEDFEELSVEIV